MDNDLFKGFRNRRHYISWEDQIILHMFKSDRNGIFPVKRLMSCDHLIEHSAY